MVVLFSLLIFFMISNICFTINGASPSEGSSSNKQAGPCHQGPGDGQHLLFAPAQGTTGLIAPFGQDGKQAENVIQIRFHTILVIAQKRAHIQVFKHGQIGKIRRPSGTWLMPMETILLGFTRVMGVPIK
jgi:hypothetical protein